MPGSIPNVAINIKIKYNKKTRPESNNQLPMDEMRAIKVQKRQITKIGLHKYCMGLVHCLTLTTVMDSQVS